MRKDKPRFHDGDTVKVLYSANDPHLEGKIVKIVSRGIFRCNSFWYDCEFEGKKYNLTEKQIWYKD